MKPKQTTRAVRCASQKNTLAMQWMLTAICTLAAEIHCDVGHDAVNLVWPGATQFAPVQEAPVQPQ